MYLQNVVFSNPWNSEMSKQKKNQATKILLSSRLPDMCPAMEKEEEEEEEENSSDETAEKGEGGERKENEEKSGGTNCTIFHQSTTNLFLHPSVKKFEQTNTHFSFPYAISPSLPSLFPRQTRKTFSPPLLFFWETHLSVLETKPPSLLPDSFHPVQQATVRRRKRRRKIGGRMSLPYTQFEKQGNHRPVTNQEKHTVFFSVSLT